MDWAVLSYLCVCGRERDVICDCVCTLTVPPSVCVSVYLLRQVHEYACVCSHRELRALSVETDHPMMGDHWKIRLGFHTHLSMEMSNIKNWCHFLKWHRSLSSDGWCILICLDALWDGSRRKRPWEGAGRAAGQQQPPTAAPFQSLYSIYRICAGWPQAHQGRCMDVINRDLGWISI